jgi:hypothetical protein
MFGKTRMPIQARTNRRGAFYVIEQLQGQAVQDLEMHWRESRSAGRPIQINLSNLDKIDDAGQTLLFHMFSHGAELVIGKGGEGGLPLAPAGWSEIAITE